MEKIMSLIVLVCCLGGCEGKLPPLPPINFPEKDLEWVIIYGWYRTEDPERLKEAEEWYRQGGRTGKKLTKEEWESYLKRNPNIDESTEKIHFSQVFYCYNKRNNDGDTLAAFPYLKARLYDREGNILEEDFLRFDPKYEDRSSWNFAVHIPYDKEGYRLKTVKLKGKKEVKVFGNMIVLSKEELIRKNIRVRGNTSGVGFQYQENIKCHTGR